jgi:NADH-ubiquinone oxidoreductase 11 kDa subunit
MSFLGEFVGHLIRRNMEDPEERRKKRNAHLQDMDTRAQALCVDTHTLACMHAWPVWTAHSRARVQ